MLRSMADATASDRLSSCSIFIKLAMSSKKDWFLFMPEEETCAVPKVEQLRQVSVRVSPPSLLYRYRRG